MQAGAPISQGTKVGESALKVRSAAQSAEKMTKVCREDKSLPREYITSTRAVQSAAAACCQEGIKSTARAVQVHVKTSVVH